MYIDRQIDRQIDKFRNGIMLYCNRAKKQKMLNRKGKKTNNKT